jgi:hypothetical protein
LPEIIGPVIFIQDNPNGGGVIEIKNQDVSWDKLYHLSEAEQQQEIPREIRWVKTHETGFRAPTKAE